LLHDVPHHPKRRWLRTASIVFCTYLLLSLIATVAATLVPSTRTIAFHFNLAAQLLIIHTIGYVVFIYPDLFLPTVEKYKSSQIDHTTLSALRTRLIAILDEEKPYLDAELDPEFFHEKLGITKHQFSQLMTVGLQTTFYDLINSYRIDAAKRMLLSPEYDGAKILHVALDSGFSNKSSFLRNFKKITGVTPSEFRSAAEKSGSNQLKGTATAVR
jgi:AraC-like DNA-binding protein